IEFSDFECPYCGRFSATTLPEFVKSYVDAGKVQFAFRHLPLERLHPLAVGAAEAAECGRLQGKFWQMHDSLFASPKALDRSSLATKARGTGLDPEAFQQCMENAGPKKIGEEVAEAEALGIASTPSFLFGRLQPDGRVKIIRREGGALPWKAFSALVDD